MTTHPEIQAWTDAFARAVRSCDFAAGRNLFSPTVRAFGTVAPEVAKVADLQAEQWSAVWPSTGGFEFRPGSLQCELSADQRTAVVTGLWSSQRRADGGVREGRATIVLSGDSGTWLATHSHFSVNPTDGGQLG